MRLLSVLAVITTILFSTISTTTHAEEVKKAEKESIALTAQQKIKVLQKHIIQLKQQVDILNQNQQAIAKKIGLTAPKKQPEITIDDSASLGDKEATVVMVEFTDLHCPFCKKFNNNVFPELKKQFIDTGKLLFIGKHFPIVQLHPNAAVAAFSLECAREDVDYKKAKDWLFERGKFFSKNSLAEFTDAMGLDSDKFNQCVSDPATATNINKDMVTARAIGVNQTPSFAIGLQKDGQVVDWKIITGAQSVENFGTAIAEFEALAKTKD